ncbi:hypothetical protein L1987_20984 [Smallanthus sonchifolius]|uniref:Uncharacterized protein n=1 Tax=Smallanthus sonchifolius TaxID=185202 RepID=A0ACB9IV57_9ASTR|nr:hypothetical protein L1987_20984 [Smallanthus sonchifolius]
MESQYDRFGVMPMRTAGLQSVAIGLVLPKSTMAAISVAIEYQTPERDNNCHLDCLTKIQIRSTNSDFAQTTFYHHRLLLSKI